MSTKLLPTSSKKHIPAFEFVPKYKGFREQKDNVYQIEIFDSVLVIFLYKGVHSLITWNSIGVQYIIRKLSLGCMRLLHSSLFCPKIAKMRHIQDEREYYWSLMIFIIVSNSELYHLAVAELDIKFRRGQIEKTHGLSRKEFTIFKPISRYHK